MEAEVWEKAAVATTRSESRLQSNEKRVLMDILPTVKMSGPAPQKLPRETYKIDLLRAF
jgi:hypothetical protein